MVLDGGRRAVIYGLGYARPPPELHQRPRPPARPLRPQPQPPAEVRSCFKRGGRRRRRRRPNESQCQVACPTCAIAALVRYNTDAEAASREELLPRDVISSEAAALLANGRLQSVLIMA